MTVLSAPTPVSQRDGSQVSWEWCGPAVATSICDDDGKPGPIYSAVTWLRNNGDNPNDGTQTSSLVRYLQASGIPCHEVSGNAAIDAALNREHRLVWLIWTDGRGNPNGSRHTMHFVQVWGHDGAGYHVQNPLGDPVFGANQIYSEATFIGNSTGGGIEIDLVLPKDKAIGAGAQDEPMHISTKRALVRLAYLSMGREPESWAAEDGWAKGIADDGSNADEVVSKICDSPEGTAWRSKLNAVVHPK